VIPASLRWPTNVPHAVVQSSTIESVGTRRNRSSLRAGRACLVPACPALSHLENTVAPVWTAEHGVRMFVVLDVCGFHVSPGCLLPREVVENRRMGFISAADGLIIDARAFNGCERLESWSTQNPSPG
jgi:hypothetical protein